MIMLNSIRKILIKPAFADEEQNRKANLLLFSLLAMFFGSIVGLVLFLIFEDFYLNLVFSYMLVGNIISFLLLRSSHLRSASLIMLIWLLTSFMLILTYADGIHDMVLFLFPVAIMIASMLLDRRDFFMYSSIVFLSIQGLIICELTGMINNKMSHFTTILDFFSVGIIIIITVALTYTLSKSIRRSFAEADQSKCSLMEGNRKLHNEVIERKQAEERLAESEGRLSDLVSTMSDWIWEVDADMVYTHYSTKAKSVLGYREDEIIGKTPLDFMPPDEAERVGAVFDKIVRDKRPFRDMENSFLTKDGRRAWMLASGIPILADDGELLGYRGVNTDITERKEAEEEIRVGRERLKILNKILRHDLANDFVVIGSAINIYKRNSETKMLDEIEKRVDKSLNTIKRLQEQESFMDSHSFLNEYDIRDVVNSIASDHPDVAINIEGSGSAFADESLYSVFENLINNAVKHGNSKKIDVSISTDEQFCEIRFKDHGIGIPDEIKDRIFEEGFTHGETGNTGIGLYIVKQTIEGYKGDIHVEDNEPRGAIFTIKLRKVIA